MIEHLVTSTVLIIAVWILSRLMEKRIDPRLRYALWLLVVVKLLVPVPAFSPGISVMDLVERAASAQPGSALDHTGDSGSTDYPDKEQASSGAGDVAGSVGPGAASAPDGWKAREEIGAGLLEKDLTGIFRVIQIAGSVLCAAIFLWARLRSARMLQERRIPSGQIKGRIRVYLSPDVTGPCLYGSLKPAVYLPEGLDLSAEQRRHVLLHEYVHYRQGDHIWAWVRSLCAVLYWYDPFVWIAVIRSIRDSELACDCGTLRRLPEGEHIRYGKTLILIAGRISDKTMKSRLLDCPTGAAGGMREMQERIRMIRERPRMTAASAILLAAACIGLVGCTFSSASDAGEKTVEEHTFPQEISAEAQQTETDVLEMEGGTGAWYETAHREGMIYQQIPLYAEREEDKVCIAIEPSVLRSRLSYYYIPDGEEQERLVRLVSRLDLEGSTPFEGRAGQKESGWRLCYQDLRLTAFDDGSFLAYQDGAGGSTEYLIDDQELYDQVRMMLEETVGYRPFDPADIKDIVSAKLDLCGFFTDHVTYSQTVTDPAILAVFEELFANAGYIFGGADCGSNCACLELTLADGQMVCLSLAADSCTSFGINGVYYDYRPERYRTSGGWHSYDFYAYFDTLSDKLP